MGSQSKKRDNCFFRKKAVHFQMQNKANYTFNFLVFKETIFLLHKNLPHASGDTHCIRQILKQKIFLFLFFFFCLFGKSASVSHSEAHIQTILAIQTVLF